MVVYCDNVNNLLFKANSVYKKMNKKPIISV